MPRFILLLITALGVLAPPITAWSEDTAINPHHLSAETCGACHKEIYAQWKTSMHSQASPLKDPIHAGLYREVVGPPDQEGIQLNGTYPVCLHCHAPNASKDQKTKINQYNYHEGVNCVVCHTLKTYRGKQDADGKPLLGINAYEVSKNHLQAPSGRFLSPENNAFHPIPMEPNQLSLRTSTVCMGCHAEYKNAQGIAICQTGTEVQGNSPTCQSCHMPKLNGLTDHSWPSAHSDAMLTRAVVMSLHPGAVAEDKVKLTVRLQNMLPHRFPTGVPYRNALLKISAFSKNDELLWSNFKSYPLQASDDPQAFLKYRLGDAAGQEVVVPFTASQVLADTRLKPFEVRELHYELPAAQIYTVRAELLYNLLTSELAEKFADISEGNITNPAIAAIAEIHL